MLILVTKDTIAQKHIHLNFIDNSNSIQTENTLASLKANNINFILDSNHIKITKGSYLIQSNIIVEDSFDLEIEKSTEFRLNPNVSVLIHSNTDISGTKKSPIIIRNEKKGKAFGTFSIAGRHFTPTVNINNLHVSGGSEAYVQGLLFTGQFAIYNSKVTINNSSFKHSSGDDGLNLKYCKAEINNCSFLFNKADQVDLDFCFVVVDSCSFSPSQIDPNGDGIDFSGSKASISNSIFEGFVDKGASVGEQSTIYLFFNRFNKNKSAITIKDQSKTYSWENSFENNEYDYSLFIKKQIFSKPSLYILPTSKILAIKNMGGDVNEIELIELIKNHTDFSKTYLGDNHTGKLMNLTIYTPQLWNYENKTKNSLPKSRLTFHR